MGQPKELPTLRGEELYIPFVGAIIEREVDGGKEVLIQIREKDTDTLYSGSIEIPGGKLRAFEDIYTTVRREAKEESGMEITFVSGEDKRQDYTNKGDTSSLIEPFCVTQMSNGPFIGLIFLCRAKGEPLQKTDETKEARWMKIEELREIITRQPDRVYTAFLAPLKKYVGLAE